MDMPFDSLKSIIEGLTLRRICENSTIESCIEGGGCHIAIWQSKQECGWHHQYELYAETGKDKSTSYFLYYRQSQAGIEEKSNPIELKKYDNECNVGDIIENITTHYSSIRNKSNL